MSQTDRIDEMIYGLDEDDKVPFNTNFEFAGHESNLFITSFGTPFYYLKAIIIIMLVKRLFAKCPWIHEKLNNLANQNGLIRFFL